MLGPALRHLPMLLAFNRVRRELRELSSDFVYSHEPPESMEDLHRFQASLVARKLRMNEDRARVTLERVFYEEAAESFAGLAMYPGAADALDAIKADGLKLGALSDFPCDRKLELFGVADRFDAMMTSEETGKVKPSPEPFQLLCERLSCAPADILYVGNSEEYDVVGAKDAGMDAALIARTVPARTRADFTFFDFADLVRYIRS